MVTHTGGSCFGNDEQIRNAEGIALGRNAARPLMEEIVRLREALTRIATDERQYDFKLVEDYQRIAREALKEKT